MRRTTAAIIPHWPAWIGWPAPPLALVLATLLACSPAAVARALTLEEAQAEALKGAPGLVAGRARAEAAREAASAASLARLPKLDASLQGFRSDQPVLVFGGLLSREAFAPENFGSFDPQSGAFDLTPVNDPEPITHFRSAVAIRQPIWTGGALRAELDARRAESGAAAARAARSAEAILVDVERGFRSAILAENRLQVLRESLAVARGNAARTESLRVEGLALDSDHAALVAHVLETEAALAGAVADSVEARSLLGLLLGREELVTEPLTEPGSDPFLPALDEALASVPGRADLEAAAQGVQAAEAGRRLARAAWFPAFELGAWLEHNSETVFESGGDQWGLALLALWSFDLGVTARQKSASAAESAARADLKAARDRALHETRAAHGRVVAAEQRGLALEAAVDAASESFRLVEARHREGLTTTLELTESQNTLTRTRLLAAEARQNLAVSRSALRLAAGLVAAPEQEP